MVDWRKPAIAFQTEGQLRTISLYKWDSNSTPTKTKRLVGIEEVEDEEVTAHHLQKQQTDYDPLWLPLLEQLEEGIFVRQEEDVTSYQTQNLPVMEEFKMKKLKNANLSPTQRQLHFKRRTRQVPKHPLFWDS